MSNLLRISITIENDLLAGLDQLVDLEGGNRSEVVRELIRARLQQRGIAPAPVEQDARSAG